MKSNTNATKSQNWLPISLIIFSILLTALPWAMLLIWPNIIVHLYYMVPGLVLLSAVSIQTINQNFKQAIQEANNLKIESIVKFLKFDCYNWAGVDLIISDKHKKFYQLNII